MLILTNENKTYEINEIPNEIDDISYSILDYSNPQDVDYYFLPLVFLESFSSPVVELLIDGKHKIRMPLDWSIIIGEEDAGNIEVVSLKHINDRGFQSFVFNPITGYTARFMDIEVINFFPDIKWFSPKLKSGHILSVPLEKKENSLCAFFIKESNKIPESLDIYDMI